MLQQGEECKYSETVPMGKEGKGDKPQAGGKCTEDSGGLRKTCPFSCHSMILVGLLGSPSSDGLTSEGLHKDLHPISEMKQA